ncbi:MFS transporter [Cryobacterium sp. Y62]|uniref:MFS transporter n=1 Tax=Cryobacterium sp. Y62 TaxID=2048284 RepID=UPI000CE467DC|nr:MFS transporter [Cryobacterium sp. Y62]
MTTVTAPARALGELGDRTLRKVRRRVMPLIVLLYFISYLDRNNVGFAKLTMSADIGLSATAFGLGAGIFFIGYAVFEIPSNAAMYRFGARKWIARILISWGICAAAMALVNGATTFYVIRFLLGVAEAGFFPAVLFYLTLWFPVAQRVAVLGIFMLALPISNALGAPLSALVLGMEGVLGLHGWQWVFILEGIPAVLLGIFTPKLMTNRPADATWLSNEEREWLTTTMDNEQAGKQAAGKHNFLHGLRDSRTLVYSALYFGFSCGIYGLALWIPTIIAALGNFSIMEVGLIVAIPYTIAAFFVYFWARRSDRTGKRAWHASVSMVLATVGLLGAGFLLPVNAVLSVIFLTLAAMGFYSAIAPFLAMPSAALAGAAVAASLAMVNSVGNLGGFVAPFVVGILNDATGNNQGGLIFLATCLAITSIGTYLYARRRPEGYSAPTDNAAVETTLATPAD